MAKDYRTLKLSWLTTTTSIDVRTEWEEVEREDYTTTRQAIDGTRYNFVTGYKRAFEYDFDRVNADVLEFFLNAFEAFNDDREITFERELDDGTFESMQVIMRRPEYQDDSVTETGKVYREVTCRILEI